jgi:uncharacterized protein (DUF1499 family)
LDGAVDYPTFSEVGMAIGRILLTLALVAAAAVVASGLGARFGVWRFGVGFQVLRFGVYASFAVAALAFIVLLIPKWRANRFASLAAALIIGLVAGVVPAYWFEKGISVPPINDITTDTANPPAFAAIIPLRAGAPVSSAYPGESFAKQQRGAYPDIKPVELEAWPPTAFARALDTAKRMGWEIVATDPVAGRIEATATTPWFGFKDDVVIRITPGPGGSRVDIRSVSRVGKSDLGANAARIRAYVELLNKGSA